MSMSQALYPLRHWWNNQYRWHLENQTAPILRRWSRRKIRLKVDGRGNRFVFGDSTYGRLRLLVKGNDNVVHIGDGCNLQELGIQIYGSNNEVHIGARSHFREGAIYCFSNEGRLHLEGASTFAGTTFAVAESSTSLRVGRECMFSTHIELRTGDSHGIYDQSSGNRVNPGADIEIGERVWIGTRALILKGTVIPGGCVVGAASLVRGRFDEPNCILAGQPAKVLRQGVVWTRDLSDNLFPLR